MTFIFKVISKMSLSKLTVMAGMQAAGPNEERFMDLSLRWTNVPNEIRMIERGTGHKPQTVSDYSDVVLAL